MTTSSGSQFQSSTILEVKCLLLSCVGVDDTCGVQRRRDSGISSPCLFGFRDLSQLQRLSCTLFMDGVQQILARTSSVKGFECTFCFRIH